MRMRTRLCAGYGLPARGFTPVSGLSVEHAGAVVKALAAVA